MAEGEEKSLTVAHRKAALFLLNKILEDEGSSITRDYAESYALLTGRITSTVTVNNG